MEFHNQALKSDIDISGYEMLTKYIGGLAEYIRKELKTFDLKDIGDAMVKGRTKKTNKKEEITATRWAHDKEVLGSSS